MPSRSAPGREASPSPTARSRPPTRRPAAGVPRDPTSPSARAAVRSRCRARHSPPTICSSRMAPRPLPVRATSSLPGQTVAIHGGQLESESLNGGDAGSMTLSATGSAANAIQIDSGAILFSNAMEANTAITASSCRSAMRARSRSRPRPGGSSSAAPGRSCRRWPAIRTGVGRVRTADRPGRSHLRAHRSSLATRPLRQTHSRQAPPVHRRTPGRYANDRPGSSFHFAAGIRLRSRDGHYVHYVH